MYKVFDSILCVILSNGSQDRCQEGNQDCVKSQFKNPQTKV